MTELEALEQRVAALEKRLGNVIAEQQATHQRLDLYDAGRHQATGAASSPPSQPTQTAGGPAPHEANLEYTGKTSNR